MDSEDAFFTVKDLAERWKVSVFTIRRMVKAGKIKTTKIGRQFRFLKSDIEKYEQSRTIETWDT